MQINHLLLSLAIPAAAKSVDVAAQTVQSLGRSFVESLHGGSVGLAEAASDPFENQLNEFASQMREFLALNGVSTDFRLRFEVDADGEQAAGVAGVQAERVAELLSQNPSWMQELRGLAAAGQANKASPRSGRPPHLAISISDTGTSHWTML